MKRGAEKQLTKDDRDDDEIEEVAPSQGFKKADEAKLTARPMKGLPRRAPSASAVGSVPAPATSVAVAPEQPGRPKFNGFTGFGATAGGTTPFSFSASTPATIAETPKLAVPALASSPFGSSSTAVPPSTSSTPAFGSSATAATKAFTSILSSATTSSIAPAPQVMEPRKPAEDAEDEALQAEIKFLIALRGINVSFLSTISKAIETDPFVDIADLLDRYKSFRVTAKEEYNAKLKKAQNQASSSGAGASASSTAPRAEPASASLTSTSTASAAAPAFTMPAPPSSFTGFKTLSSSTSPFGTSTSKDIASGGSGFSPSPATSMSTSTSASSGLPAPPKSAFTFGSSASTSSSPFTFGKPAAVEKTDGGLSSSFSAPAPSAFSSNLFTKPDEETKSTAKAVDSPAPLPTGSSSAGSVFGGPSFFSTPEKKESGGGAFAFGAGPKPVPFAGFGKPAGNIGNPVGFGFGSPPRSPEIEPPAGTSTPSKTNSGFSFAPAAKAESSRASSADAAPSAGEGLTPAPEAAEGEQFVSSSNMDAPGEGEEHEDIVHEVRSKVYRMVKNREGKAEWNDLGVGMLRLKKHKDSEARRVLMRNSNTGKVIINFQVYMGMSPSVGKNTVSFMGHEEGVSTPYRIRMKSEGEANDLKSALDREIEFVRAKSETS